MEVAGYKITTIVPEYLSLDGGAMFGLVPKTLWSKLITPDEQNRIRLSCRVLLLEGHGKKILVDLGAGRKWNEKEKSIYNIEYVDKPLHEQVSGITDIILTHLHFDHAGGISKLVQGNSELSFPDARVFIQERHLQHARTKGVRDQASFLSENLQPLEQAKLSLTNDGDEILPRISVHRIDGHTHGQQWVKIGEGRDVACFVADLIPTAHHLRVPYVMCYDLSAERAIEEKKDFLEKAVEENWCVIFEHDSATQAVRLKRDDKGHIVIAKAESI